jgi:hypothetical protein
MSSLHTRSAFPPPPPYYKDFLTEEEVSPPPPPGANYSLYGVKYSLLDEELSLDEAITLEDAKGVQDKAVALKRLSATLSSNCVELIDFFIQCPVMAREKIVDIEVILINMHFIINSYRPHQVCRIPPSLSTLFFLCFLVTLVTITL